MPDKYKSFADLSKDFSRAADYHVIAQDRSSPFLVLAIHGGAIEPATSEIAKAIASDDFSYYLFEGLGTEEDCATLHITSSVFDEPKARSMVSQSRLCISIHGFKDQMPKNMVIIGGGNAKLREMVFESLLPTGLIEQTVPNPLNIFHGEGQKNIANRGTENGLQVEVSRTLRDLLCQDAEKMKLFANAVRQAVLEYAQKYPTPKSKHLKGPPS